MLLIKMFLELVEMALGLVYASFSLPERQALKMTFFAPCATDGSKILIKSIYGTAPKSLLWAPAVYQDLSTCHDWPVENAIVDLPVRLNGNTKSISGNLLRLLGAPNKDTNTDLQALHVLTRVRLCLWCRQCCRVRKWLDCSGQNKVIISMGLLYVGVPLFSGLSKVTWAIPLIP